MIKINHATIFTFTVLLTTILFSGCDQNQSEKDNSLTNQVAYSFFVAGHVYGTPGVNNVGLHPPFENQYPLIRKYPHISFGVLTGDIVAVSTPKDWDEVDASLNKLGVPVHFAFGNHDISSGYSNIIPRYGKKSYKSFNYKGDLFIILDPNLDHWNISGDQFVFLANEIAKHKEYKNIFIFFHQVLWWNSDNIFSDINLNSLAGRAKNINFTSKLLPLFKTIPNKVYLFAGDVGAFSIYPASYYYQKDNLTFIASGMGGHVNDNFIIVKVENGNVSFDIIALNGTDIHAMGELENYDISSFRFNVLLRWKRYLLVIKRSIKSLLQLGMVDDKKQSCPHC